MEFFFQWFHSTKFPEKVANAPNGNRKHERNEAKIFLIDMNDIWTLWELIPAIPSYTHTHILHRTGALCATALQKDNPYFQSPNCDTA